MMDVNIILILCFTIRDDVFFSLPYKWGVLFACSNLSGKLSRLRRSCKI